MLAQVVNADATPDTFAATADTSNDGDRFKGMKEIGAVEMDTNGWILPPGATTAPTYACYNWAENERVIRPSPAYTITATPLDEDAENYASASPTCITLCGPTSCEQPPQHTKSN